jgi:hypothetical protein
VTMPSESPRAIAARLRARQAEVAEEIMCGIPEAVRAPLRILGGEYERAALASALDYALGTLEGDPEQSESVPLAVVEQVRRSARDSVSLDTVLCFYVAGRELLGDIVSAEAADCSDEGPRQVQVTLGLLLQQLVPVIASAYQREIERLRRSPQQRRAGCVRRLLNNERVDAAPLGDYDFDAWHIAMIVTGSGAKEASSRLEEAAIAQQVLPVEQDDETLWCWLGGRRPVAVAEIERFVAAAAIPAASFAIGEPGFGLEGWRVAHRQAEEARSVAVLAPQAVTTYAAVGVLAPWALDRAHAMSFVQTHLGPLDDMRDGGVGARDALREIFRAGHQITAAASALNVHRGTLQTLRARIERRLGFMLATRQAELEVALRLEALYRIVPRSDEAQRYTDH